VTHRGPGWQAKTTPASEPRPEKRWRCSVGHITIAGTRPTRCSDRTCAAKAFEEVLRG